MDEGRWLAAEDVSRVCATAHLAQLNAAHCLRKEGGCRVADDVPNNRPF